MEYFYSLKNNKQIRAAHLHIDTSASAPALIVVSARRHRYEFGQSATISPLKCEANNGFIARRCQYGIFEIAGFNNAEKLADKTLLHENIIFGVVAQWTFIPTIILYRREVNNAVVLIELRHQTVTIAKQVMPRRSSIFAMLLKLRFSVPERSLLTY